MTFISLLVIIGSTDSRAPHGFAPLTNTSVNPARRLGPAIFAGGWALGQVWLFVVAPMAGAQHSRASCSSGWSSARGSPRVLQGAQGAHDLAQRKQDSVRLLRSEDAT
jgi:hypothetical protein